MSTVPRILSAELEGIIAEPVHVEADLNVGLHSFSIVGLADKAVTEAKERVNSALKNSGIKPPTRENRRITVNLAPADVKKAGSRFDLPIALAYLLASDQIRPLDTRHSRSVPCPVVSRPRSLLYAAACVFSSSPRRTPPKPPRSAASRSSRSGRSPRS